MNALRRKLSGGHGSNEGVDHPHQQDHPSYYHHQPPHHPYHHHHQQHQQHQRRMSTLLATPALSTSPPVNALDRSQNGIVRGGGQ